MDPEKISGAKSTVMSWFAKASWADKQPFLYSLFYTIDVSDSQNAAFHKMSRAFMANADGALSAVQNKEGNRSAVLGNKSVIDKGMNSLVITTTPAGQGGQGRGVRIKKTRKADLMGEEEKEMRGRKKIKWTEDDEMDEDDGEREFDSKVYKTLDDNVDKEFSPKPKTAYWNKSEFVQASREGMKSFIEYREGINDDLTCFDGKLQEAPKMMCRNPVGIGSTLQEFITTKAVPMIKENGETGMGKVGGVRKVKQFAIASASTGIPKKNPFLIAK